MEMEWTAPGRDKAGDDDICFKCDLAQVKTMADGGYRITLDLGENDSIAVSKLMQHVRRTVFDVKMSVYL